jgi:hypothetical protein
MVTSFGKLANLSPSAYVADWRHKIGIEPNSRGYSVRNRDGSYVKRKGNMYPIDDSCAKVLGGNLIRGCFM